MKVSKKKEFVGAFCCAVLPASGLAAVSEVATGSVGQCYDIESDPFIYEDPQVIRNLRLLGLEPVTAHGATPSRAGDDTQAIQDAIFTAIEDCVNAQGLDPEGNRNTVAQGKPSGADSKTYIDGCRAVFFPPGDYRVSDTIRVMQPLASKSGTLDLELNSSGQITFNGTTTPEVGIELQASNAGTGVALRRKSNVLIGSTCPWGPASNPKLRPVITARPGYFASEKPVVQFWAQCRDGDNACSPAGTNPDISPGTTDPANGQSSVLFNNVFRNIDIDSNVGATDSSGNRNTGAIGIAFPGAQGSVIEDSTITLTDGNGNHSHTGIRNVPGQSGGVYNVTVNGGQFGLWMDRETRYGMAVGLRLFDQTNRAILHRANNKLVVVGFHITRQLAGPAVRLNTGPAAPPLPAFGSWSGIAMVDGVIENNGNAAIDVKNRPVYLKNVLIGGAGTNMVTTGTALKLTKPTSDTWQQVNEWAYVSNTAASGVPYSMIDGILDSDTVDGLEEVKDVGPGVNPVNLAAIEAEYIAPHIWRFDDLPSFEDSTSIIILAKTYDDNTVEPLLYPSNTYPRVFLGGGGRHPVDATVELQPGQALAGLDRVHTVIETQSTPNRSAAVWCASAPMISTTDASASDAAFGRVSLAEYRDCTSFTPVDWKAGENSTMHGVMLTRSDKAGPQAFPSEPNQAGFRFAGSGGGRHWGLQPEGALIEYQTNHVDYRHLSVFGTSQPLNIYGFNCEKVSGGKYACELNDASNVNLFNVKAETCKQCAAGPDPNNSRKTSKSILRLRKTQDVNVIGYGGNARPSEDQRALIVIDNASTSNLTLALINPNTSASDPEDTTNASNWFTVRENISNNEKILGPHIGGYVRE